MRFYRVGTTHIIGPVRRESSTVVVLVGAVDEPLLAGLARSSNVSLVRPPEEEKKDPLTAAALALGQAAGRASPYVVVAADPLAEVAAEWAAMWDLTAGPGHAAAFEERAAAAVAAWRAGRFELPDYYVALTPGDSPRPDAAPVPGGGTGMYLGPLRAARPRRVGAVVTAAGDEAAENTERVLQALRTLRHGPWWPPLDELLDQARNFFAGSLGQSTLTSE